MSENKNISFADIIDVNANDLVLLENTQILRNKFRRLKGKRINPFALIPV
ncbi:MAG: hypothetical protein ACK5KT_14230 [Dysgonomonas sp.]